MRRLPLSLRRLGARVLGSVSTRIREGPNAGLRWSVVSSGRGYGSGTFEPQRVAAITALLRPGDTVWDIGAHKGYVSLAAARVVGAAGTVFAFEPSAENRAALERHIRWNSVPNVRVLPVAVSDTSGEERFGGPGSTITFRLGAGPDTVETRTIASLIESDGLAPPDVLKIDAEYSEAKILRGGLGHLSPRMLIWISVHSRELHAECRALLASCGFEIHESAAMAVKTSDPGSDWGGDKELLAVGVDRPLSASELAALELFRTR